VILEKDTDLFRGCLGFHGTETPDPELGLWLRESAQGRGYGREAASAVIAWARANLGFDHLRYPVDKRNFLGSKTPEQHGVRVHREFRGTNLVGFELDQVEYWIGR